MSSAAARPPGARPGTSGQHLYTELARTVRESGLHRRRYGYYWSRISIAVVAFGFIWWGVIALGNSWFQLILAGVLGVLVTQFGFLGHDAAHQQVFRSSRWNEWTARILAGVFAGLSYGWWRGEAQSPPRGAQP